MTTRAGICWAFVVWAVFARLTFYVLFQRCWKRPTQVKGVRTK